MCSLFWRFGGGAVSTSSLLWHSSRLSRMERRACNGLGLLTEMGVSYSLLSLLSLASASVREERGVTFAIIIYEKYKSICTTQVPTNTAYIQNLVPPHKEVTPHSPLPRKATHPHTHTFIIIGIILLSVSFGTPETGSSSTTCAITVTSLALLVGCGL